MDLAARRSVPHELGERTLAANRRQVIGHAKISEFNSPQRTTPETNQRQHQSKLTAPAARHHDETFGPTGRGQMLVQAVQPDRMLERGRNGVFEQRCVLAREEVERIVDAYVEHGFRVMHTLKQLNQCRFGPEQRRSRRC